MIPYFELREIPIAPGHSVTVFGTLVAAGICAGILFAQRRARATGIDQAEINGAIVSVLVPGFLLAHAFALLSHVGDSIAWSPRMVLQFWNGMSSFGGFLGAFLGLAFHYWRSRGSWLPVADALTQALVIGWIFGRLGCTLVHDHIGAPTDFPLGIHFPDTTRHDLGFYEFLYTILVLAPAIALINRKPRRPGIAVAVIVMLYAPARFLGDFLRHVDLASADPRYFGLTFAQYGCILLAAVGIRLATRKRSQPHHVRTHHGAGQSVRPTATECRTTRAMRSFNEACLGAPSRR